MSLCLRPELKSELDKANNTKKKLRKLLRDFEDEFQRENGRKVQREDRGPMDNKYQEYKVSLQNSYRGVSFKNGHTSVGL